MPGLKSISRRAALAFAAAPLFAIDTREPAPKFHAKTMTGEKFNNASVKGSALLLQFWATWCPYCKRDQPAVDAMAEEFASKGLIVLAVDVRESRSKVERYLANSPRAAKIVLMDDTNLAAVFEAKGFPLYVLIDQNGKIAGIHKGAAGEDGLRHLLRKAIEID
jgi:thiol-disulfide isomerase/thioredoxin